MAFITIIVPVYKVEPYLHRCVDSILAQSFPDFELILVDDGSPDNCGAICDDYAAKDRRVHVIHQQNGGLSAARNAGIDWAFANSDSQWLTFVDSDDWIHPDYLKTLLQAVEESNTELSICGFVRTTGPVENRIPEQEFQIKLWAPEDFWCENHVNAAVAWGKLYQKSLFKTLRYPVGRIHEDEFTTYQILFSLSRFAVVAAPLYRYYQNAAGIMKQPWRPARMDDLDANEAQIAYFRAQGFLRAFHFEQKRFLYTFNQFRKILTAPESEYIKYYPVLVKKLRHFLRKNKSDFPFKQNRHYYEIAYPRIMHLYRILRSVAAKIYRMFRKKT